MPFDHADHPLEDEEYGFGQDADGYQEDYDDLDDAELAADGDDLDDEEFDDGFDDDDDDLLAALDDALDELEEENRVETREAARPSWDVVEVAPTQQDRYREGAQSFICGKKIPKTPGRVAFGRTPRPLTLDRSMQTQLSSHLKSATMTLDQMKMRPR